MTNFLLRRFVPNCRQSDDPQVRSAVGKLAGVTGIVCNSLLFALKLAVGLLTGAVSIVADAVNNLSDMASSVVTLLGFHLARRPADEEHPYGHARYEYLAGLAVAVLILFIGLETAKGAVSKIIHPEATTVTTLSCVLLLGAIGVKWWMSRFFGHLGRLIDSTPLTGTAADSRNDIVATAAVLAGCLVEGLLHVNVDGFVGLAVAAFILWSGFQMAKETVSLLLGRQADAELVEKLKALVLAEEKVQGLHDLLIHDYGPGQCFASVHAQFDPEETAVDCHNVIDAIERRARTELNVNLVIHLDHENDAEV